MAVNIMIQGTMSSAGKSILAAGLCRVFTQDGYRTAPFKSQNMALNSFVTEDGLEMGRAQVVQAEACGRRPDVRMNPVLLKPTTDIGSQVIVHGRAWGHMAAREYFKYKRNLIPEIMEAYTSLDAENDIIVIEGAGSPAEINLKSGDIVNMGLAEMVDAPVLLVGDIDRGGVFAQLLGTVELLEPQEKERICGLIINKFRGDRSILEPGLHMIEERCGIPVLGVIPWIDIDLDDEDSLTERFQKRSSGTAPGKYDPESQHSRHDGHPADQKVSIEKNAETDNLPSSCGSPGSNAVITGHSATREDTATGTETDSMASACGSTGNHADRTGRYAVWENAATVVDMEKHTDLCREVRTDENEKDLVVCDTVTTDRRRNGTLDARSQSTTGTETDAGPGPARELTICVIRLPRISNFSDFTVFETIPGVRLLYVNRPAELSDADLIILPGTRSTMQDLIWMKQRGLEEAVVRAARKGIPVAGICGGYQMLGERIRDPEGEESSLAEIAGLGLLPLQTVFSREKTTCQVSGRILEQNGFLAGCSGLPVKGYEIHQGRSYLSGRSDRCPDADAGIPGGRNHTSSHTTDCPDARIPGSLPPDHPDDRLSGSHAPDAPEGATADTLAIIHTATEERSGGGHADGMIRDNVFGTYMHGIFDNPEFTEALLRAVASARGLDRSGFAVPDPAASREAQFDRLAATIREGLDLETIREIMFRWPETSKHRKRISENGNQIPETRGY